MAGKSSKRWRTRRGKARDGPFEAGLGGQGLQVPNRLLDVTLPGHDHEERALGDQQGHEPLRGPDETGETHPVPLRQSRTGVSQGAEGAQGRQPAEGGPGHDRRIRSTSLLVERPGWSATRTTRPPAASTSVAPTISSAAQSSPFTSTSGPSARIVSRGVGSS